MKKLIILSIGFFSLYSCGDTNPEIGKKEKTEEAGHDHGENTAIELDNGNKWKVVDEMMLHIQNMERDVTEFKGSELADYKNLSSQLTNNLDLLTSNCTMTGKAHDELHKWLLPYIDLVDELSKASTKEEASSDFEEIKSSFETFNKYFQ